jgi:site-specific recombinase XerC
MTAAALVEWRASMWESRAAIRTMQLRIQTVECLLRYVGKSDPLELTRQDVATYLSRPVKPWTAATYYRCLRAWDRWARDAGYITASITEGIPAPRTPPTRPRPLTEQESRAVLAARPLLGRALRR